MLFSSWLRTRFSIRPAASRPAARFRPRLEALERRDVLSFGAPISYSFPPQAGPQLTTAAADLNGDGKPDLIALGKTNFPSVEVRLNNGDGTFGATRTFFTQGTTHTALTVGDVNRDGKPDIVFASYSFASDCTYISTMLGDGKGGFSRPVTSVNYPILGSISALAVARISGGFFTNLVAVAEGGGTVYVAQLYPNGAMGPNPLRYSIPFDAWRATLPEQLAVSDVNGDGRPDVVVTSPGASTSYVSVLLTVQRYGARFRCR